MVLPLLSDWFVAKRGLPTDIVFARVDVVRLHLPSFLWSVVVESSLDSLAYVIPYPHQHIILFSGIGSAMVAFFLWGFGTIVGTISLSCLSKR